MLSKIKRSLERGAKMDQETGVFGIAGESCTDEEFGIETEEHYDIEDKISWYKDASRYEPTEYTKASMSGNSVSVS